MVITNRRRMLAAAVLSVGLSGACLAATATFTPASGNQNWTTTGNWDTGAYPDAAGDVANVNNNITAQVNISLIAPNITLGTLNLGDSDGSSVFTIAGASLTFDSGVAGTAAQINVRNNGTVNNVIGAPLTLNSNLDISLSPSTTVGNRQALTLTGSVTTTGRTITVTGGYKGTSDGTQMTFGNNINSTNTLVGNGTIINNSDSPMVIQGDNPNFTGRVIANGQGVGTDGNTGTVTLTQGSLRNAAEIVVNGYHDGTTLQGGKLQIGTGSTFAPQTWQRLTQNRITMNGGLFNDGGVPLTAGNYTTLQTDTVAHLNFNSGFSLVNVTGSNVTAGNVLNVTAVERGAGATAFFRAAGAQTSTLDPGRPSGYTYISQMKADNGASLVVGSTATSGTATRIIPWMVASGNVSNLGLTSFATYDDSTGFRYLKAGEYSGSFATGANVTTGNMTNLTQDWTVNSLFHNGSGVQIPTKAGDPIRTITITSGGLAFSLNGGGIGEAGNAQGRAGNLEFGSAEAVIINAAAATNYIGSAMHGTGGLTKGGFGRLIITGTNTITGDTHVSGGVLQVGDGTYTSQIASGDVYVDAGAVLDIRGLSSTTPVDAINDGATLNLLSAGLFNGQLNIVGVETVGAVKVNGSFLPSGDYTASSSGLSGFVTGTGTLHVVPEPTSLAALGIVSLLMLRRRQH